MIDLTTLSFLRIKSLLDTPGKCEVFSRYTPLITEKKVLPEKLLEILVKNKKDAEGKGIERALNILFEEQSRV
ncbi:MAG: hypothetical protein AAB514_03475 [Patescibacteria group bacterium]